jgi:hypothetical protein
MWAVDNGNLDSAKFLIEEGKASLSIKNKVRPLN